MALENINVEKLKELLGTVEKKLHIVILLGMGYIIYFQACWIKDLTAKLVQDKDERHVEDKEYMIFFRDQWDNTQRYLYYSNPNRNEKVIYYPLDTSMGSKKR